MLDGTEREGHERSMERASEIIEELGVLEWEMETFEILLEPIRYGVDGA